MNASKLLFELFLFFELFSKLLKSFLNFFEVFSGFSQLFGPFSVVFRFSLSLSLIMRLMAVALVYLWNCGLHFERKVSNQFAGLLWYVVDRLMRLSFFFRIFCPCAALLALTISCIHQPPTRAACILVHSLSCTRAAFAACPIYLGRRLEKICTGMQ